MVSTTLADLLRETVEVDCEEGRENERTPTPIRVFGVRLHSMGLALREIVAVGDWLGVDRSRGAIWNWAHTRSDAQADPPTAAHSRDATDETQSDVDGDATWLDAVIDTESKLLVALDVFGRRGTDPAAAVLHRPTGREAPGTLPEIGERVGSVHRVVGRHIADERVVVDRLFPAVPTRNRLGTWVASVRDSRATPDVSSIVIICRNDRIVGSSWFQGVGPGFDRSPGEIANVIALRGRSSERSRTYSPSNRFRLTRRLSAAHPAPVVE